MTFDLPDCSSNPPPIRHHIETEIARLSYLEWGGAGQPVLLLHGITSSARAWWRVAPALVERGYHVYALDMPGHGDSDAVADHRLDSLAALVGTLLHILDLKNVILIGHSWGGATALTLASGRHPLRAVLSRVTLIDPAMRMSATWGEETLPRFLHGIGMNPEDTLRPLRAANRKWHECDVVWKAAALQQCRTEMVRGFFLASGAWDLAPHLALVTVPLLLMVAAPTYTVVAPDIQDAAKQALRPGLGQLVTIPKSDHNIYRGEYDAFMQVLMKWLADG